MKTFNKNAQEKRKKELGRQQYQKEKAERLVRRQQERERRGQLGPEEDPDIAGIVPGPQPTLTGDEPEAPAPTEQKTEAGA